ncbi:helix-turn-helix domain-containing protein [Pseudomonadota bacterium]
MPKQDIEALTNFGKRLVKLRKAAGYTQVELAKELEVTQRMISYYEGHSEYPPSALLPRMAQLLDVTADELLGIQPLKKVKKTDTRLQRRMQQIEKLPTKEKRQIMQLLDTFIEREQLKQQ